MKKEYFLGTAHKSFFTWHFVGCSNSGRDRPKSFKQIVLGSATDVSGPRRWQQMSRVTVDGPSPVRSMGFSAGQRTSRFHSEVQKSRDGLSNQWIMVAFFHKITCSVEKTTSVNSAKIWPKVSSCNYKLLVNNILKMEEK